MKTNIKTIVIFLIITTITTITVIQNISYNIKIAEAKEEIEIVKAEKSEIELQKEELEELEKQWQEAQAICESKVEIEDKIHNLRNLMLGLQ